jgi:hypothetical protein
MNYIIISLKHGDGINPIFWRANNSGYTEYPFCAGIYTEEQVKADPGYYNDGFNAVAIPLTDRAMEEIGFTCSFNGDKLKRFYKENRKTLIPQS